MISNLIAFLTLIVTTLLLTGALATLIFQILHKRSERYADVEWRLADHNEAFELYGIDLKVALEKDGVTADQIIYLSAIISVLIAEADSMFFLPRSWRIEIYLRNEWRDYWPALFGRTKVRQTWVYSKKLHSKRWRDQIDAYLNQHPICNCNASAGNAASGINAGTESTLGIASIPK